MLQRWLRATLLFTCLFSSTCLPKFCRASTRFIYAQPAEPAQPPASLLVSADDERFTNEDDSIAITQASAAAAHAATATITASSDDTTISQKHHTSEVVLKGQTIDVATAEPEAGFQKEHSSEPHQRLAAGDHTAPSFIGQPAGSDQGAVVDSAARSSAASVTTADEVVLLPSAASLLLNPGAEGVNAAASVEEQHLQTTLAESSLLHAAVVPTRTVEAPGPSLIHSASEAVGNGNGHCVHNYADSSLEAATQESEPSESVAGVDNSKVIGSDAACGNAPLVQESLAAAPESMAAIPDAQLGSTMASGDDVISTTSADTTAASGDSVVSSGAGDDQGTSSGATAASPSNPALVAETTIVDAHILKTTCGPGSMSIEGDAEMGGEHCVPVGGGVTSPVATKMPVLSVPDEGEQLPSFDEWKEKMLAQQNTKGDKYYEPSERMRKDGAQGKAQKMSNYASEECGAKIVAKNPEASNANSVLNENKDDYLINPCSAKKWFVIELCDPVEVRQIELGNLELFSSLPKNFTVYISANSERYPTTKDGWRVLGLLQASEERTIHMFHMPHEPGLMYTKYVKIEVNSHYGHEHYCPLTLVRVYGSTMVDDYDDDDTSVTAAGDEASSSADNSTTQGGKDDSATPADGAPADTTSFSSELLLNKAAKGLKEVVGIVKKVLGKAHTGAATEEFGTHPEESFRAQNASAHPAPGQEGASQQLHSTAVSPSVDAEASPCLAVWTHGNIKMLWTCMSCSSWRFCQVAPVCTLWLHAVALEANCLNVYYECSGAGMASACDSRSGAVPAASSFNLTAATVTRDDCVLKGVAESLAAEASGGLQPTGSQASLLPRPSDLSSRAADGSIAGATAGIDMSVESSPDLLSSAEELQVVVMASVVVSTTITPDGISPEMRSRRIRQRDAADMGITDEETVSSMPASTASTEPSHVVLYGSHGAPLGVPSHADGPLAARSHGRHSAPEMTHSPTSSQLENIEIAHHGDGRPAAEVQDAKHDERNELRTLPRVSDEGGAGGKQTGEAPASDHKGQLCSSGGEVCPESRNGPLVDRGVTALESRDALLNTAADARNLTIELYTNGSRATMPEGTTSVADGDDSATSDSVSANASATASDWDLLDIEASAGDALTGTAELTVGNTSPTDGPLAIDLAVAEAMAAESADRAHASSALPVVPPSDSATIPLADTGSLDGLSLSPLSVRAQGTLLAHLPKREAAIMRLSNIIKTLEQNLTLTNRYLEEMSRKYRKQKEEMQKALNATIESLNKLSTTVAAQEKDHAEELRRLQSEMADMAQAISNATARFAGQQNDGGIGTVSVLLLTVLLIFFSTCGRKRNALSKTEVAEMMKFMADAPPKTMLRRCGSSDGTIGYEPPQAQQRLLVKCKSQQLHPSASSTIVGEGASSPSRKKDQVDVIYPLTWRTFDTPYAKKAAFNHRRHSNRHRLSEPKLRLFNVLPHKGCNNEQHTKQKLTPVSSSSVARRDGSVDGHVAATGAGSFDYWQTEESRSESSCDESSNDASFVEDTTADVGNESLQIGTHTARKTMRGNLSTHFTVRSCLRNGGHLTNERRTSDNRRSQAASCDGKLLAGTGDAADSAVGRYSDSECDGKRGRRLVTTTAAMHVVPPGGSSSFQLGR